MAQAWKLRLPNGQVITPAEWSSTPLYSTVEIDDGSLQVLQAFSYGIGGTVPGSVSTRAATRADTNLQGSGAVLAENEELLLYTLMVECFTITAASVTNYFSSNGDANVPDPPEVGLQNMLRVQQDTLLVLKIANTKEYMRAPVGFFPPSMGVHNYIGDSDNSQGTDKVVSANGSPNAGTNRLFATPHRVAPGEAFEVSLEFPSGSVGSLELGTDTSARIRCRIYADGLRRRPVA